MKKIIVTLISFLIIHVSPVLTFAQSKTGETDSYSAYAVYMLIVMLFVLFTSIIFYASSGKENERIGSAVQIVKGVPVIVSDRNLIGILNSLNVIYYAVYILLAMYLIIFFTAIL